jgi:hypothetical protein
LNTKIKKENHELLQYFINYSVYLETAGNGKEGNVIVE